MRIVLLVSLLMSLSGCVSIGSLPKSTAEVDFSEIGRADDKSWHDGAIYTATIQEVMDAGVAALEVNGFDIKTVSETDCSILGSKPTTPQTWNSVVGVYCRQNSSDKVEVHVIAKGTKDVNVLAGDGTVPIPPQIVSSITSALSRR